MKIPQVFTLIQKSAKALQTYKHKKRSNALLQPFVNLKSNTMKNTVQRYGLLAYPQIIQIKKHVS